MGSVAMMAGWVAIMFAGVLMHELGHALTARAFGQRPFITLHGLGGLTTWRATGAMSPGRRLLIAAAGPSVGIAIGVVAQMNAAIQAEAQARGFAFVSLDVLFAAPGVRTPLNVVALFTTAQPFGPFMSLDGTHPNAAGQALIAEGAAEALNALYDLGIPVGQP